MRLNPAYIDFGYNRLKLYETSDCAYLVVQVIENRSG